MYYYYTRRFDLRIGHYTNIIALFNYNALKKTQGRSIFCNTYMLKGTQQIEPLLPKHSLTVYVVSAILEFMFYYTSHALTRGGELAQTVRNRVKDKELEPRVTVQK